MEKSANQNQNSPNQTKKKWYKKIRYWILIIFVMFLGLCVIGYIGSRGVPMLRSMGLSKEFRQSNLNVPGYNVGANENVRVYQNSNFLQEVKANDKGEFQVALNLTEGENIVYMEILKDGKTKKSIDYKFVYYPEKQAGIKSENEQSSESNQPDQKQTEVRNPFEKDNKNGNNINAKENKTEPAKKEAILSLRDKSGKILVQDINIWNGAGTGGNIMAIGTVPDGTKVEVLEIKTVEGIVYYRIKSSVGKVSILPTTFAARKKAMEERPESEWNIDADPSFPVEGWVTGRSILNESNQPDQKQTEVKNPFETADEIKDNVDTKKEETSVDKINSIVKNIGDKLEVSVWDIKQNFAKNNTPPPYEIIVNAGPGYIADCYYAKQTGYEIMKKLYTDDLVKDKIARVKFTSWGQLKTSVGSEDGLKTPWNMNGPTNYWTVMLNLKESQYEKGPLNQRTWGEYIDSGCY